MKMHPLPRLSLLWSMAAAGLLALLVGGCASAQIRHAQKIRAHLGAYLYTETTGSGEQTVVFVPGLMASTAYWRNAGISSLSGKHLLFVDLLGFGRSPWPAIDYTLDDQLDALRRTLVKHGATGRVTMVGHSFGTIIAAHYAARYPREVDHVFLFGTPMYRDRKDAERHVGEMSWLAGLLVRSPLAARIACTFHNAFMPLLARLAPRLRPDLPPMVAHDGVLHFWPSLNGSVQHVILGAPLRVPLKTVGSRTTIIYGSKDVVSDRDYVEEIARESGARFVLTEHDHNGYWQSWPGLIAR